MPNNTLYSGTRTMAGILLLLICSKGYSQTVATAISDPQVDSLIQKNIEENKLAEGIPGFRIQIYSDADRKGATDARSKFLQLYPEADAYLIYQQPNFRVRVGDFRNRMEAHALYKKMLEEFPEVIIVPDKINLPKL
ncbi:MAG: SPOR domain-containing protein [Bacteroidota bacterium]